MDTLQAIYPWVSTVALAIIAILWSKDDVLGLVATVIFFACTFVGALICAAQVL